MNFLHQQLGFFPEKLESMCRDNEYHKSFIKLFEDRCKEFGWTEKMLKDLEK